MNLKAGLHQDNVEFIQGDLGSCDVPVGDTYFLYFPTGPVLDRILSELYHSERDFNLVVIESHGDLIPRIELENWLEFKEEVPLESARHYSHAKIFQRIHKKRSEALLPFEHTFLSHYLLMNDGQEEWIGESLGMEWTEGERFELKTPPRTIQWSDVKKLMVLSDIDKKFHPALSIRRLGEVSIRTKSRIYLGTIRKIIVSPVFRVEISTGEKVEWKDILTITRGQTPCYDSSSDSSS